MATVWNNAIHSHHRGATSAASGCGATTRKARSDGAKQLQLGHGPHRGHDGELSGGRTCGSRSIDADGAFDEENDVRGAHVISGLSLELHEHQQGHRRVLRGTALCSKTAE